MSTLTKKLPPALGSLIPAHQGKVRDSYGVPAHSNLLFPIATNRVSTHNVIHLSEIPDKGAILTALTIFWAELFHDIPTHLLACGKEILRYLPDSLEAYPPDILTRSLIVFQLDMTPCEFIFRDRLAGSLWKDYQAWEKNGTPLPYGLTLPHGLDLMSPLVPTAFTPTDKSETDDPIDAEEIRQRFAEEVALRVHFRDLARAHALACGIEIIDDKGECGRYTFGGHSFVVIGDEIMTFDCARFVEASTIVIGQEPRWLDKQYLRDEAERTWGGPKGPPLAFSEAGVRETRNRMHEIFERLTGQSLAQFQREHEML